MTNEELGTMLQPLLEKAISDYKQRKINERVGATAQVLMLSDVSNICGGFEARAADCYKAALVLHGQLPQPVVDGNRKESVDTPEPK